MTLTPSWWRARATSAAPVIFVGVGARVGLVEEVILGVRNGQNDRLPKLMNLGGCEVGQATARVLLSNKLQSLRFRIVV